MLIVWNFSHNFHKFTINYNLLTIQGLVFSLVVFPNQFFYQQSKLTNNLEHGQMFDNSKLETFLEFHLIITISEDIVYQTMKVQGGQLKLYNYT